MRLSTVFGAVAALAATFVSAQSPATQDDIDKVKAAIEGVINATTVLSDGLASFAGIQDSGTLLTKSGNVISALTNGTISVKTIHDDISVVQATSQLVTDVTLLNNIVATATGNAVSQKPLFFKSGVATIIYSQLQLQYSSAQTFRSSIVGLFQPGDQSLVNTVSQPALTSIKNALDAYADCANATTCSGTALSSGSASMALTTLPVLALAGMVAAFFL